MKRSKNDPRVRRIMATMDRALASPEARKPQDGGVTCVGSMIIEFGRCCERFDGWRPEAIREAVLAFALVCPAYELQWMAEQARSQLAWLEWWELEGRDQGELGYDAILLLPRNPYARRAV